MVINKKTGIAWFSVLLIIFLILIAVLEAEHPKKEDVFSKSIPNGFGVSVHYTGNMIDTDLIKDAGFKVVRKDIFWSQVEQEKGIFDFKTTGYDDLTNSLVENEIRPYYILGYSNKLYENNRSIVTQSGREAYINYVDKVTSRYKNKGIIWEIWNEPNIQYWETKPNFYDYSTLIKEASKVIKNNDPTGTVVAPALSGLSDESLTWLDKILKTGTLDYIDGLSVHPYRTQTPETVISDYKKLRTLLSKYSDKNITLISGEWGYSTAQGTGTNNFNEYTQANYLVRMFLINLLSDVPISIWYGWKNDGTDISNKEQNYGIVQNDIKMSKKAYLAVNALNHNLNGYELKERIDVGDPNDYVLRFVNENNDSVIVFWTSKEAHKTTIPFNSKGGRVLSTFGEKIGDISKGSQITLHIINSPKYIIITPKTRS
ncbi:cellulase family glycosylhydrolase [Priestia megaterium]|uniref:cellulase family glycosylhydrolase n=1 Tax=Priestia megaterium TaxID=1404 RepID=UPI002E23F926|nr:cellulase family glycosylhydrolase [Priestia megaterium]MED3814399.1 cellulase family glycosylhydrolase [Priestia megaterium]